MREDKAELRARVYLLEKERSALELKLSSQEAHQVAQEATVQHLQTQLQDVERRLQAQHQQVSMLLQVYVQSGWLYAIKLNFRKIQMTDLSDTHVRYVQMSTMFPSINPSLIQGLEQEDFQTMLKPAGETRTTQGNIRNGLDSLKLRKFLEWLCNCYFLKEDSATWID